MMYSTSKILSGIFCLVCRVLVPERVIFMCDFTVVVSGSSGSGYVLVGMVG